MADDILFNIKGDSSSAIDATDKLVQSLDNLNNAINRIGESLGVFQEISDALDNVYSAANLATSGIEAFTLQTEESFSSLKSSIDSVNAFNQAISSLNVDSAVASINNISNAIADLSDMATIALDDLRNLGAAGQASAGDLSSLPSAAQQVATAARDVSAASQQAAADLDAEAAAAQKLSGELQALDTEEEIEAQDIKDVSASLDGAIQSTEGLLEAAQNLEQAFNNLLNQVEEATLGIRDLGQQSLEAASAEEDAATAITDTTRALGAQNAAWASTSTAQAAATTEMIGFGSAAKQAEEDAAGLSGIFGPDSMNLIMMASAITMVGGSFVQMGMDAEDAFAHVSGLADQTLALGKNAQVLQGYIKQVEDAATQFGVPLAQAADGFYNIISDGFQASDALKVLSASMQAAAGTGTEMATVSNALTSVLTAYSLKGDSAAKVTDQMVQAVVSGKQEFGPFANAIGAVASSAEHAHVSIAEMFAAEAQLTMVNPRVRQDAQELAHLFNTLSNNAQDIVDSANAMGAHLTLAGFNAMDLYTKLKTLSDVAKGDTTPAFRELLHDTTSATVAFDLLRNKGDDYLKILESITKANGTSAVAFQQASETITFQIQRITSLLSVLSYEFVTFIGPIVSPILDKISESVKALIVNFDNLKPVIAGIVTALGVLLAGSIVALTGFMLSLSPPMTAVAVAAGGIATAFVALQPHVQALGQWFLANVPGLNTFLNNLRQIGDYIGSVFIQAWNNLQVGLANFMLWFNTNVKPHLIEIVNLMVDWANKITAQVIPAIDKFINNTLKPFATTIQRDVIPQVQKLIEKLLELVEKVLKNPGDAFQKLIDFLKKVGEAAGAAGVLFLAFRTAIAVVAAGGIVQFLQQAAAPLIEFFVTKLPAAIGGLAPLWAAITSPIGLVIVAVVALIGYFIYLSTQSEKLKKVWATLQGPLSDVWKAIQGAVKEVVDAFNKDLKPALADLAKAMAPLEPVIRRLAEALGVVLIAALGVVLEGLAALITGLGKGIASGITLIARIITFVKDFIKLLVDLATIGQKLHDGESWPKIWKQIWEDVYNVARDIWHMIQALWNTTFGAIFAAVGTFVDGIIKFFTHLGQTLVFGSIVPDMLNAIVKCFKDFPGKIVQIIDQWVKDVIKFFQNLADELVGHSIVPDMIQKIVQLFQNLPQEVSQAVDQFVQNVIKAIQQWAQDMIQNASRGIQGFVQSISQGFQSAIQAVQQGIANIARPFQELAQKAMQWGKDFIGNFAQGIMGAMGGLLSTVMSMASSIASYLHFSKPDVGPLSDADQWMPDFGDMLTSGLNDQVKKVGSAARNVSMSISGAAPNLNGFAGTNGSSEQTQVLKQILMELRTGNQAAAARGTIGYRIPSTELGSINQQFNTYNTNAQAAQLYNQINTLGGLAQEYAQRGARTGLGF